MFKWHALIIVIGFLIFLCSLLSLKLTKLIYLGMRLLTFPIGVAISFVILAMFYYLLLTPVGLIFRLIGRDSLHRKWDSAVESYWIARRPSDNIKRYFNQF